MPDRHGSLVATLETSVLDGAGSIPSELRRALAGDDGNVPADLAAYAELIRQHASQTGDDDVAAVMAAGYTEDQVYEITVSIALGAGLSRLRAGLTALDESLRLTPEPSAPEPTPEDPVEESEAETSSVADEPFTPRTVADPGLTPLARREVGA